MATVVTKETEELIQVRGARQHNLKTIHLDIPRDCLVVLTGLSGSGKSSLAYDTLYAEGQRRYIECLSTYARQFLEELERADVDLVDGLPPTITVRQETTFVSPRSTVATVTEVYDYLRLLYARIGQPHCYRCGEPVGKQSLREILDRALERPPGTRLMVLAPVVLGRKGTHRDVLARLARDGFVQARIDGKLQPLDVIPELSRTKRHTIEAVVDRIVLSPVVRDRLGQSLETALRCGQGLVVLAFGDGDGWKEEIFNTKHACHRCGISYGEIAPRTFSFNSPSGACPACDGLGIRADLVARVLAEEDPEATAQLLTAAQRGRARTRGSALCPECQGSRLRVEARHVLVGGKAIHEVTAMTVTEALRFLESLSLRGRDVIIGRPILHGLKFRLEFLEKVGLGYLTLDRPAATLSGGESQRLRLAAHIGSGVVGACYILDEPTIGLHPRDNERLLGALRELRDAGNTVIVVEHDEATIRAADYVIDLGPGPGRHGGEVVAAGTLEEVLQSERSLTAQFLRGERQIPVPAQRRTVNPQRVLRLYGVRTHNLKNITVTFPLGVFIAVTGVSGSGKSSLVMDTLVPALRRRLGFQSPPPGPYRRITGFEHLDRVVEVDASPIGRMPRSNPATYVGVWDFVRRVFAGTKEAKARGFTASRFSTNVRGGRCEACQGLGVRRVEMQFLPDLFVTCEVCHGKRFNEATLSVKYQGRTIADVLNMTVEEALDLFRNHPAIARPLTALRDVGLGYLTLGQPSTTLSGGEAQRVKLAFELSKRQTGRTLYVLDEPTTGLHLADVENLLKVVHALVDMGNTVVVIEHHLDVIKTADYVIDLGPEGSAEGGRVVAAGTPEEVAAVPESYTGQFLRKVIPTWRERQRPSSGVA